MQILSPTQPFFYYSSFGNQKSNTAIFFLGYNLETLNPTQLLFLGDLLEVLYPTQPLFLGIFWKPEPNKATFLVDLLEAQPWSLHTYSICNGKTGCKINWPSCWKGFPLYTTQQRNIIEFNRRIFTTWRICSVFSYREVVVVVIHSQGQHSQPASQPGATQPEHLPPPPFIVLWLFFCFNNLVQDGGEQCQQIVTATLFGIFVNNRERLGNPN